MKTKIIKFLQFFISNRTVFLKLRDTLFCNPAEHLFRIVTYAELHYKNKLMLPVLDIGAASGGTAAYFSKNFSSAPVIAFEPINKMYDLAVKTNAGNKNVTIKNIGLFDTIGENSINITANYLSSSINNLNAAEVNSQIDGQKEKFSLIEKQVITTSTLDEQTKNLKEILLIKLDTQGSELTILKQGKESLKKTHLLLIEMSNHNLYHGGAQYYEIDTFLRNEGFKLVDVIVTYRPKGFADEYDAIYENTRKW